MIGSTRLKTVFTTAIAFAALCADAGRANAGGYSQTNLVSDIPGLATISDPSLKNPWGLSFFGTSPVWISDQGTTSSTLYSVTAGASVTKVPLTVAIPPVAAAGPTGQVANASMAGFDVGNGGNGDPALFIFANLNGSISAWNGTTGGSAITQWTTPGASYTGLAINQADTRLYAANDAGAGSINVFDNSFNPVSMGGDAFATPSAIGAAGLVPFNVTDIGGNVFVTYAPSGHKAQTDAVAGEGAVAVFTESGALESMKLGGELASPWGVALAPMSFGKFGGDVLVGNFAFGDSVIDAFDPATWAFEGSIAIDDGGNDPGGLWSLAFGGGGGNGDPNMLFFTDGLNSEGDGLFGAIVAVPEPSTWALMLFGLGGLGLVASRRRGRFVTLA